MVGLPPQAAATKDYVSSIVQVEHWISVSLTTLWEPSVFDDEISRAHRGLEHKPRSILFTTIWWKRVTEPKRPKSRDPNGKRRSKMVDFTGDGREGQKGK